jgi:GMP synthase-like glutamine amidotransferase
MPPFGYHYLTHDHLPMKVGLLQCDHVADRFRSITDGDYDYLFSQFLPEVEWQVYDLVNGHFPEDLVECAAYLCTGSVHSVYDDLPWIHQLKELVRKLYENQKTYIGVCFGHQMLAEALGGKVGKAECGWCVGAHTFEVIRQEEWMVPFQASFNILMSCQDQVLVLPPDSTVLARTSDCPVGMFRVGERMLGVQGHPEFTKEYSRALLEDRRERIGRGKVELGLESLHIPLSARLINTWMQRFLEK